MIYDAHNQASYKLFQERFMYYTLHERDLMRITATDRSQI